MTINMAKLVVESLIEAGKATAAPPLGPALGPTGVNIALVVAEINKKTADLKGMQVPVKVIIDTTSKTFTIEVGTPPSAALIKKEAGIEHGAGNPKTDKVADLAIEQIIKVAKTKSDSLLGKDLTMKVREIIGTCQSMGILIEGMDAQAALKAVAAGQFDAKIKSGKTEITQEERAKLEEEKHRLEEDFKKRRSEYETKAKQILKEQDGKDSKKIRQSMLEAGIPIKIVDELAPAEKKDASGGKGGAKGAPAAKGGKK